MKINLCLKKLFVRSHSLPPTEAVVSTSPAPPLVTSVFPPPPSSAVAPSPTPPAVTDDPTPQTTDPVVDPVEGSVAPSRQMTPLPLQTPAHQPPHHRVHGGDGTMAIIGIVIGLLVVIIIVLTVLVILFALRRKKQKTIVLEQPQGTVLESKEPFEMTRNDAYTAVIATERNVSYMTSADVIPSSQNEEGREPFEMTGNDAYTAVITTERNEAYVTNIDVIPAARNEAYGAVATEWEGGNSLNRDDINDAVYTEPQDQTADDQGREEYSYAYVR